MPVQFKNCIIVCDSADHDGGVSAVVLAQTRGLRQVGLRVYVFAAFGPADPALAQAADGVVCMQLARGPRSRSSEIWNPSAAAALAHFLRNFPVHESLVHIHSLSTGLSPAIATALREKRIPFIITAHDAGWSCPTGYFYNFQTARPCPLEPLSRQCLSTHCDKRSVLHKAFKVIKMTALDYASHLKRDAAVVLVPSDLLRQRLRSRVPKATPVVTLLNPVSASDLGPRAEPGQRFLFVGRIWDEKGILQLLQAIGNTHPLTVIGDGPQRAALAAAYPQVVFTGWLAPDAVAAHMRQAIALVLPSIYLEAFGLVVAEALAQGVPVIVSSTAGAASLVEHGVNGFVVDMTQAHALADSCAALMDERSAARMSRQAYRLYWNAPLTTRAYTDGLVSVFDAIGDPDAMRLL